MSGLCALPVWGFGLLHPALRTAGGLPPVEEPPAPLLVVSRLPVTVMPPAPLIPVVADPVADIPPSDALPELIAPELVVVAPWVVAALDVVAVPTPPGPDPPTVLLTVLVVKVRPPESAIEEPPPGFGSSVLVLQPLNQANARSVPADQMMEA